MDGNEQNHASCVSHASICDEGLAPGKMAVVMRIDVFHLEGDGRSMLLLQDYLLIFVCRFLSMVCLAWFRTRGCVDGLVQKMTETLALKNKRISKKETVGKETAGIW